MPIAVRPDLATRAYQLTAYTSVGTSAVRPWVSDTNGPRSPVNGVVIQLDLAASPGTYIEYGGPDITPGNGLQLGPGDSAIVNAPNAAAIWIVPSTTGLTLRGQVQ